MKQGFAQSVVRCCHGLPFLRSVLSFFALLLRGILVSFFCKKAPFKGKNLAKAETGKMSFGQRFATKNAIFFSFFYDVRQQNFRLARSLL
jgi:hypothetical protein